MFVACCYMCLVCLSVGVFAWTDVCYVPFLLFLFCRCVVLFVLFVCGVFVFCLLVDGCCFCALLMYVYLLRCCVCVCFVCDLLVLCLWRAVTCVSSA